jgi:hypothetical protein
MPDPDSAKVMAAIDRMQPKFRALVHEFGAQIVSRMIGDGYSDAVQLKKALETWRERRQKAWLES